MEYSVNQEQPSLIFDNLDFDLVVKVLAQTAFSPFFSFLFPLFFLFQGFEWRSEVFIYTSAYTACISLFWLVKWLSQLYRNGNNIFLAPPQLDWGEQIVVITGGASGIGELLANTLAVRNVTVVVLDINPIVTENYNIAYYKCDISNYEELQSVHRAIIEEIGNPTILINNAGVVQGKTILELSPNDIRQTVDTNLVGQFWTLKTFLPDMIKNKKGHIVTMSSILGVASVARMTDYCATKAALVALNDSLRYELDKIHGTPGIRTTLALTGHVSTRMFATVKMPSMWLHRFFIPVLPPHMIIKAIIHALDAQESRTIYMPFYTHFVRYTTLMPSFIRDFFQWLSGADYAMRNFVKISGRRADEGPVPNGLIEGKDN